MTAPPGKNWSAWLRKYWHILIFPPQSELCVSLVSDGDMRELNRQYRQIDTTTDVLCFPQKSEATPDLLGDIVISYQTVVRHSRRLEITVEEELRLLVVHAVLHLLGFDHKKKKQREGMREKEKEVLNYLAEAVRLGTMSSSGE